MHPSVFLLIACALLVPVASAEPGVAPDPADPGPVHDASPCDVAPLSDPVVVDTSEGRPGIVLIEAEARLCQETAECRDGAAAAPEADIGGQPWDHPWHNWDLWLHEPGPSCRGPDVGATDVEAEIDLFWVDRQVEWYLAFVQSLV